MKFYECQKCGNIIKYIKESGMKVVCCGQEMTELVPGTSDGAHEKHVPVIAQDGGKVTVSVGSVEHPMMEEHFIQWIILETQKGSQKRILTPADAPKAEFTIEPGDEVIAAYEYCNLHGLWKSKE